MKALIFLSATLSCSTNTSVTSLKWSKSEVWNFRAITLETPFCLEMDITCYWMALGNYYSSMCISCCHSLCLWVTSDERWDQTWQICLQNWAFDAPFATQISHATQRYWTVEDWSLNWIIIHINRCIARRAVVRSSTNHSDCDNSQKADAMGALASEDLPLPSSLLPT